MEKKFCSKCGKELANGERFCPSCGKNQYEEKWKSVNEEEEKYSLSAFYVAVTTLPILFVLRMSGQVSEHVSSGFGGAWRGYDKLVVPGNVQAIMIMLIIISTILNISMSKKGKSINDGKSVITKIMLMANIIIGLALTFVELSI